MKPSPLRDERVRQTLSIINNLDLTHPSGPLLSAFMLEALDPVLASSYVNDRLSGGDAQSLISDWVYIIECITRSGSPPPPPDTIAQRAITRRDGGKCCITGKKRGIFDPLFIVPILPIPVGWVTERKQIFDMLGAFFGPPYRDWWLSYIKEPRIKTPYGNHWLVRRSAATAFANGFVYLDRQQPSMIEYMVSYVHIGPQEPIEVDGSLPLLGDHSRSGIVSIDARFIGTHARLCSSIRFLDIARSIAPEILGESLPPSALHSSSPLHASLVQHVMSTALNLKLPLIAAIGNSFLTFWRLVPWKARIAVYELLRKLGAALYGPPNDYSTVQRLPFGLYLKYHGEAAGFRNEFNALRLVRQYTTIPVPKPLDVVAPPRQSRTDDQSSLFSLSTDAYVLITRLPGVPLSRCQHNLSNKDCERIVGQMRDYLTQLRSIPNLANHDAPICNTLGEACRDPRIRGEQPVGPFADEASFSQMLRFSDEPSRRGHNIVFTHADLNPRNILVDEVTQRDGSKGWSVTGIVDWECAGYYPEYWDYTKAMFEGFRWIKRYNDLVKEIFKEFGDYSQELDVETRSWETGDGI
ncbi:kinase-like domain-containing protein [Xylariaceae sp. AK1471]|nr:kinase-like domain-containing protein [Xylariaceae sp. AK1471]